jgi:NAD-dependent deacetylase
MSNSIEPIVVGPETSVLVLTGAGVSAESGVATFRQSADGLWENHRIEDVASPEGFAQDPALVWRFYSERRAKAAVVSPNPGHYALVELEKKLGDRFLLVTQNVDGLHGTAGSQRVIEIHGNLFTSRCTVCERAPFEDRQVYAGNEVPGCGECAKRGKTALLRPHIVWFGEALDGGVLHTIKRFMSRAKSLLFVAAGTSGAVYPAANFVRDARFVGADTVLINQDRADNASQFHRWIQGKSGEILPTLFTVL